MHCCAGHCGGMASPSASGSAQAHAGCSPSTPYPVSAETVLVFTKSELHALAGPKKTNILEQLEGACAAAGVALRLHPKPKKEDGAAQVEALLAACRSSGDSPVVGTLPKVRRPGVEGVV